MDDLASHRAERQRARLVHAVRHARAHATPVEALDLERLIKLERLGHLTLDRALALLAELRREQELRRGQQAA